MPPTPPAASPRLALPAGIEAWSRAPIYARVSGYLKRWTRRHRHAGQGGPGAGGDRDARSWISSCCRPRPSWPPPGPMPRSQRPLPAAGGSCCRATRSRAGGGGKDRRPGREAVAVQGAAGQCGALRRRSSASRASSAPFDGVITARNTDVGALISVGGAPRLGTVRGLRHEPAARLCERSPGLRGDAAPGAAAQLSVPERPGQT